jgi:hypothetical protein
MPDGRCLLQADWGILAAGGMNLFVTSESLIYG